jgi:hypothetical protein
MEPICYNREVHDDDYCRCKICKPGADAMARSNARTLLRLKVALILAGFLVATLMFIPR